MESSLEKFIFSCKVNGRFAISLSNSLYGKLHILREFSPQLSEGGEVYRLLSSNYVPVHTKILIVYSLQSFSKDDCFLMRKVIKEVLENIEQIDLLIGWNSSKRCYRCK